MAKRKTVKSRRFFGGSEYDRSVATRHQEQVAGIRRYYQRLGSSVRTTQEKGRFESSARTVFWRRKKK